MTRSRFKIMSRFTTIAMSALLIIFSASCSSDALPTGPSSQASQPQVNPLLGLPIDDVLNGLGGGGGLLGQLLTCGPQPYASASKVIGPDGGTLNIGKHTFVVPRGALKSKVLITAEAPEGNVISVRFAPEGLKFNSKAQPKLTLDYSSCGLIPNLLPKHIAYTDDQLSILSILSSVDNLLKQQVSANIKHFSRYAVAF
jgi:hypothetical protein